MTSVAALAGSLITPAKGFVRSKLPVERLHRQWTWRFSEEQSLARFVNSACAIDAVELPNEIDGTSVHDLRQAGRVDVLAKAIYKRLAELEVRYDEEGYNPGPESTQRIRSPGEIVRRGRATCLDLALLYAGLAMDLGLEPIVVVLEGHALVAVKNAAFPLPVDANTTGETVNRWIKDGHLLAVEVIGATRGKGLGYGFDEAEERAAVRVTNLPFGFAIDPTQLQGPGDVPAEPCDRWDPLRGVGLGMVLVATVVGVVLAYRWTRVPMPDADGDVVAVPSIEGANPETTQWLARWLGDGDVDDRFVDFSNCNIPNSRLVVLGPDELGRVDLDDPANPSNVDLVIAGSLHEARESDRGAEEPELIELAFMPRSDELRRAADPLFFVRLPTFPAEVDRSSPAVFSFPELATVPALLAGLREMERGDAFNLERADCAFGAAQEGLAARANRGSPRVRQFLATLDLLRANVAILEASNVPAEREDEPLARAQDAIDQARDQVTDGITGEADPLALAIVDANEAGVILISLVSDDGRVEPGVSRADVLDALDDLVARAQAAGESPPAFVALHTIAAKLSLAASRTFVSEGAVDRALLDRAAALLDEAIRSGGVDVVGAARDEPLGASLDEALALQLAEAYHVRGQSRLLAGDLMSAAADYEQAADLVDGTRSHLYRLDAAEIYWVSCRSDWEPIVTNATTHYREVGDVLLERRLTTATALPQQCD